MATKPNHPAGENLQRVDAMASERLLTRVEAAEFLRLKPTTLAAWALTGRNGLPFVRVGRLVRYRLSDLEEFVRRQPVATHTGQTPSAA